MRKIIFFIATVLFVISCAVDNNTAENTKIVIDDPVKENPIKEDPVKEEPVVKDPEETIPLINLFDMETFNEQRQLWQEKNLQSYSFRIAVDSLVGDDEGIVVVEDGKVVNLADIADDIRILFNYSPFNGFFAPIADMYEFINAEREKMDDTDYLIYPDPRFYVSSVFSQIKYDELFHFPKEYKYRFVIQSKDGEMLAGNGFVYNVTISEFTIITDDIVTNLFDPEIFNEQKQLWLEQNLQNYSFNLAMISSDNNVGRGKIVEVKDGKVINNPEVSFISPINEVSITDIFGYINRVIGVMEDSNKKMSCTEPILSSTRISAQIEYDESFHFPKSFRYVLLFLGKDGEYHLASNTPRHGLGIMISDFSIKD